MLAYEIPTVVVGGEAIYLKQKDTDFTRSVCVCVCVCVCVYVCVYECRSVVSSSLWLQGL